MVKLLPAFILLLSMASCQGQHTNPPKVGGGCDGCELMYEGIPANINSIDTSAGWKEKGQKLLVTGTAYKPDGMTTVAGVIIYYWQTDNSGHYSPVPGMNEKAKRHGHIRGWVKTDRNGRYSIYTIRPAPYPNTTNPAHIHISIKEPGIRDEYYTDELVFDDDRLLTSAKRRQMENRGGSGVIRLLVDGDNMVGEHDFILGLHIPNHPAEKQIKLQSGLPVGQDNPSFMPFHAFGPDKGTKTCPVCKYGRYQGIIYYVGEHPDWVDIRKWIDLLEKESTVRKQYLKAYFVYGNPKGYSKIVRQQELEKLGEGLHVQHTALTFVPSLTDKESEVYLNQVNPQVKNTFVIFRNGSIVEKFINLEATENNFSVVKVALDRTNSSFNKLKAFSNP